jgi:flagellar basal body-associated protein FliL
MEHKNKKIIIWLVVVIIVFAAGFGSGYLFGKSSGPGRFSEMPDGFGGGRNSGNNINSGSNSETENNVNSELDSETRNMRQQPGTQTPEGQMPQDIQAE